MKTLHTTKQLSSETSQKYSLDDLLYLMKRLRDPKTGCPWDLKQDYRSIVPFTVEEVYEVVDAIESNDFTHLSEELGDLLFQVVFYCQLGVEDERFSFDDVVHTVTSKLLRRHPHVFPDGTLQSFRDPSNEGQESDVAKKWDEIKAQERNLKGEQGLLADVPSALPSLQRAAKLQKRAAKVGLDWDDINDVIESVESELRELKEAIRLDQCNQEIARELGDVLFSCVNLSRHLKLDADQCLRLSNDKFTRRITRIESILIQNGKGWPTGSAAELDDLWQQAKKQEELED